MSSPLEIPRTLVGVGFRPLTDLPNRTLSRCDAIFLDFEPVDDSPLLLLPEEGRFNRDSALLVNESRLALGVLSHSLTECPRAPQAMHSPRRLRNAIKSFGTLAARAAHFLRYSVVELGSFQPKEFDLL